MPKYIHIIVMSTLMAFVAACAPSGTAPPAAAAAEPEAVKQPPLGQNPYVLVMLGDSLTAGLGLTPDKAFPHVVQSDLGTKVHIINAGVSGDTTKAGLDRFDWSVGPDADGVLIALGANDMLNGLDPAQTRANLAAMIEKARARGLDVYLAGMRAAPNLGPEYAHTFDAIYADLAKHYCLPLYPFLMQPLAAKSGKTIRQNLIQPDGLHPTARGAALIGHALSGWLGKALKEPHIPCTP